MQADNYSRVVTHCNLIHNHPLPRTALKREHSRVALQPKEISYVPKVEHEHLRCIPPVKQESEEQQSNVRKASCIEDDKLSKKRLAPDSSGTPRKRSKSPLQIHLSASDVKQEQLKFTLRKLPSFKYKPDTSALEVPVTTSATIEAIKASLPAPRIDSTDDLKLPRTTLPWPAHRDLYSH